MEAVQVSVMGAPAPPLPVEERPVGTAGIEADVCPTPVSAALTFVVPCTVTVSVRVAWEVGANFTPNWHVALAARAKPAVHGGDPAATVE